MSDKKIILTVSSLEQISQQFIDVCEEIEKGNIPTEPIERLSFNSETLLFKTLTPKRIEILKYAHQENGISIRALAKALERDYSNVHQDVKALEPLGLIVKNKKDEKYYVHWDTLVTEIKLPKTMKKIKSSAPLKKSALKRAA